MFSNLKLKTGLQVLAGMVTMVVVLVLVYQLPPVQNRLGWRFDAVFTSLRTAFHPIGDQPTPDSAEAGGANLPTVSLPLDSTATPVPTVALVSAAPGTATPAASPTFTETPLPTLSPTPLPAQVKLAAPAYEKQDWNNCGPASLSLYLKFYGWKGSQADISNVVKIHRNDRNVNIDELTGFVHDNVPNLNAIYRVGGSTALIKQFLAGGMPFLIEEAFLLDQSYWTKDDRWSGHYLLITGYDDATQTFITQDTYLGANRRVSYQDLEKNWQAFNRAFILVYSPDQEGWVESLLGDMRDMDRDRQMALDTARAETEKDPKNTFAWFNLGTNLVYFEQYNEAALAYDKAREIGLPQRMLRYQFGPFLAYFHAGRNDDLLALTAYALNVTPNSEEALLWNGWGLFRAGKRAEALQSFQSALDARPDYADALYAVNYVTTH
jgi:tetratricopeptide (TPR) repeat protein